MVQRNAEPAQGCLPGHSANAVAFRAVVLPTMCAVLVCFALYCTQLCFCCHAGWQYAGSFVQGETKPCGDHDLGAMWECPFLASLSTGTPADTSQAAGEARVVGSVLAQWPCQGMRLGPRCIRQ